MLTLLDDSCGGQTEGSTAVTGVCGMTSSSPGTTQHSDGLSAA